MFYFPVIWWFSEFQSDSYYLLFLEKKYSYPFMLVYFTFHNNIFALCTVNIGSIWYIPNPCLRVSYVQILMIA